MQRKPFVSVSSKIPCCRRQQNGIKSYKPWVRTKRLPFSFWSVFNNHEVKRECKKAFHSTAYRYGFKIYSLQIMNDHIHLFVDFNPKHSVSKVVQLFKGYSAYRILKKFNWVRRWYKRGHFWSAGKFYRSVGNVTADTIHNYIQQSQGSWDFKDTTTIYRQQHRAKPSF